MYMKRKSILLVALFTTSIFAVPTVIRDARVQDLGQSPALGRGYSISTNTFQSLCLAEVTKTTPSYNFKYKFESSEEYLKRTTSRSGDISAGGSYWFVKVKTRAKGSASNTRTSKQQHMIATFTVDSYYSSVDEANSKLSESARNLLVNRDIIGFFNSCGAYYTRSITRHSELVAIFSYESKGGQRDRDFEASLEAKISGFGMFKGARVKGSVARSLSEEMSSKKLTIVTRAWGMGKDKAASLVSYDMETFKQSIKDAFMAVQDDDIGQVVSVEVVPWVENTEFQDLVKVREEKIEVEGGEEVKLKYREKLLLNENSEFIAEIVRTDRALLNIYYKARLCKRDLLLAYAEDPNAETPEWREEYANATFINLKDHSRDKIKIDDLYNAAKQDQQYLTERYTFMYGGDTGTDGGAYKCVKEVLGGGMDTVSYRGFDSCKETEKQLTASVNRQVDDYCMPSMDYQSAQEVQ